MRGSASRMYEGLTRIYEGYLGEQRRDCLDGRSLPVDCLWHRSAGSQISQVDVLWTCGACVLGAFALIMTPCMGTVDLCRLCVLGAFTLAIGDALWR
jgi:hypothetical protein